MGEKITISYLSFTLYILFVIVASLLVGLLPVYINPPQCDTISLRTNNINVNENKPNIQINTDYSNNKRHKRSSQTLNPDKYLNEIKSRNPRFNSIARSNLTYCSELLDPQSSSYPWFNYRLPTNIVPIHYDLYIDMPIWPIKPTIYDGFVDIQMNVTESTDTIILHVDVQGVPIFQNVTFIFYILFIILSIH